MRSLFLKRVNILSNHILRSNGIYSSCYRSFGMFVDHSSENPTDPNDPDYIDPEEINRIAQELEEKGVPNSAGDYRQMARQYLFLKLRTTRQATWIGSQVDRYSYGQNGLPDTHDKSAY